MKNLFNYEHHVRISLGLILLTMAAASHSWMFAAMAAMLVYTGSIRYCPIFHLLGVNQDKALHRYYRAMLPEHNPEPVYLFDKHGELVFRNDAARHILPHLRSMGDLENTSEATGYENQQTLFKASFIEDDRFYLLRYKPLQNTNLITAYGYNVTELAQKNEEIISTQKELVYRMGEIGESRSRETGNHVKRVAEYSRQLALLCGLDGEEAELLKMASPMHDIGKVAIPDRVLLKPGKLDAEEWEIMKTHASIGYELLRHSDRPILQAAAIVAGQHHEKWDGSGYPNGLNGEDIHIYGRITAIADVFDALASERVYKAAWPTERVTDLLREQKGQHFDPALVDLFLNNIKIFTAIKQQYSDTKSLAT